MMVSAFVRSEEESLKRGPSSGERARADEIKSRRGWSRLDLRMMNARERPNTLYYCHCYCLLLHVEHLRDGTAIKFSSVVIQMRLIRSIIRGLHIFYLDLVC